MFSLESELEGSAHIEVGRQGHGLDGSEFEWGVACAQMYLLWFYTEEELGVETALDNLSLTDFNGDADPVSNGGGGGDPHQWRNRVLKDNMEADRRKRTAEGIAPQPAFGSGASCRDVPDVMSWAQCFSHFAAIITRKYPSKAKELWAYQSTVIGEARRCGGKGWLLYDRAFHQQISSIEEADFGRLNQALYATTFLAYGGGVKACCPHCMLPDHTREECALNPNRALPLVSVREAPQQKRVEQSEPRREKKKQRGPCYAWNDARCYYGAAYCRFEHVCSRCGREGHKKGTCRKREQL